MFFQKRLSSLFRLSPLVFLLACASPKAPTGGPKDTTPPKILKEESTPNQQTFFKEKIITLTFDEWITLKDVYNQLVVSPLMPEPPKVKQKGKSLLITLPDSLREQTTYTINFGNSIVDLNESNVLENFAFVFSTGAVLDSTKLSGTVIDAITLKPADGIWVMLYPIHVDSAVYKQKPEYVGKTNKEGKWSMANIRTDSFVVVALKDENLNFLYDQETELFGWLVTPIYTNTPEAILPEITVFPREKKSFLREVIHHSPGWIKILEDGPLPKSVPVFNPPLENEIQTWDGDTLHLWYSPDLNYAGYAVLNADTTRIRVSTNKSKLSEPLMIRAVTGRLHPTAAAQFSSEVPLVNIDTSRITLVSDSLGAIPFVIHSDSILIRRFSIKAAWKEQTRYSLTFLPGALTDFWKRTNDTLRQSIIVNSQDQFGDLTMPVEGLDSTKQYLVLIKSGDQIIERFIIDRQTSAQLKRTGMAPGKYTIELIEDTNHNGIWDTGDYHLQRQPERKKIFILENLRAGWEQESKLSWL